MARPKDFGLDGCEHATGWPLPAAWYEFVVTPKPGAPAAISIGGGIALPDDPARTQIQSWGWSSRARALPLRPIWVGLGADVAVYACAWVVPLGVIGAARRWRRERLGMCGACGYSMAGLRGGVCPECGNRRQGSFTPD